MSHGKKLEERKSNVGNIPLTGKATKSSPTWSHPKRIHRSLFSAGGFQLPFPHRPRSDFQSSQGQRLAGAEPLPTPLLLNPSCIFSLETRNVICSTIQRNRDGLLNRFIHLPPEASGFTGGCKTLRSWEHSAPQTVPGKGRDYFSYT